MAKWDVCFKYHKGFLMLKIPEFPKDFFPYCPCFLEEKENYRLYGDVEIPDEDAKNFAYCAFVSAGVGLKCENCDLFLTRDFQGGYNNLIARRFLSKIESFYEEMHIYEKKLEEERKLKKENQKENFDKKHNKDHEDFYKEQFLKLNEWIDQKEKFFTDKKSASIQDSIKQENEYVILFIKQLKAWIRHNIERK